MRSMARALAMAVAFGACVMQSGVRAAPAFACWRPQLRDGALRLPACSATTARSAAGGVRMAVAKKTPLAKALKKPTGALTVSIEFDRQEHSGSTATENDLIVLSMQLRKSKAATLWTPSLEDLALMSKEQKAAKGNFPGPCPVVYYPPCSSPDAAQIESAASAGADAVVLRASPDLLELRGAVEGQAMEVIWDARSAEEMRAVVDAGVAAPIFLVPGADVAEAGLLAALPAGAVGVASVDRGNDEIVLGRNLAKAGLAPNPCPQTCTHTHTHTYAW